MGVLFSRLCPCLGVRDTKIVEHEYSDLRNVPSVRTAIKKEYEIDNLSNDELHTQIKYYVINKRHYCNI